MKNFPNRILFALAVGLAGCSSGGRRDAAPEHLQATLISPVAIELKWRPAPDAAGQIVEWATAADGEYVPLAFLWPHLNSFTHPDLMPETTCWYRVRPYFGPASNPVEITTAAAPPEGVEISFDETWADAKTLPAGVAASPASIRDPATAAGAAPTDLRAKLVHPTGIQLTWIDHASDEGGYLLEMKTDTDRDFNVCAIVGPNVNSYGYALVSPETTVRFRVRAYYYGRASNLASMTTRAR